MRTTRLYISDQFNDPVDSIITLDADSSRYLCKVMRYTEGSKFVLFNGDGNDYHAVLLKPGKSVQVKIESWVANNNESKLSITLVQALAKGTKLDLIIQKATELGVARIALLSTERTVLQLDPKRAAKKLDHWNKVAQSACGQCDRSVVPSVDPIVEISTWLANHKDQYNVLIDPCATHSFKDLEPPSAAINIIVGPEGGFSDRELKLAQSAGVTTVRCGPRVLRTETAGFAAIAIVQALMGDMN